MSSRSKRDSRGSTRGKRESESRSSSARVKRERDREREPEAPSFRSSPVRVKREVEPASAREAPTPVVPVVRVKREREADEDSEPEREVRGARGRARAPPLSRSFLSPTSPSGKVILYTRSCSTRLLFNEDCFLLVLVIVALMFLATLIITAAFPYWMPSFGARLVVLQVLPP